MSVIEAGRDDPQAGGPPADGVQDAGAARLEFQAEVSRLLHLMVHAVYSEKEIFLRELISNASDACDRLRYLALTEPALTSDDATFRVVLSVDKAARTLTLSDNGIGMNRDDMVQNLGTIARSGTSRFVEQLSGDSSRDVSLIGQFGVGFYSVFMVADRVDVTSRKAGEDAAWTWSSDGLGGFTVAPAERATRGTTIVMHLKEGEDEWLEADRLRRIVKTHSDHIALPIVLKDAQGEAVINAASAIWTRSKGEVTAEQHTEFYRHVAHAFDAPWATFHYRTEGRQSYAVLLYVPETRPFDLFDPKRLARVKLYVRRVFITDDCEALLPGYLRFLRGIVDSEDLPLNVSREMLQNNALLARMRQAITKRVLGELEKKAEEDPTGYATFWENFGPVLKEGLYEDAERRDQLLKLARFRTTKSGSDAISLADYVARMKEGQEAIYYITGDDAAAIGRSPQVEGYLARDIEVLLLSDPVDDFWLSSVDAFDGKSFKSVTKGGTDLARFALKDGDAPDQPAVREADLATLIVLLKQELGDAVKDVRSSDRLTGSAVCLVADDLGLDMHLARLLRQHRKEQATTGSLVLELNPRHALIAALAGRATKAGASDALADAAHLLLDQARIVEGEPLADPAAFARRLAAVMTAAIA
ncbi:molecular chaperone HtpG [Zavarzinia sp. CC-PAN008]|uniref:molecular chaperone HtpG n=1 Tax=Zavarzinia sp. CC-PAN008 TaxID=3243332 RepID=UPI003F746FAA